MQNSTKCVQQSSIIDVSQCPGIDSTEITTKRLLLLKLPKPVTPDAELLLLIFFDWLEFHWMECSHCLFSQSLQKDLTNLQINYEVHNQNYYFDHLGTTIRTVFL